LSEDGTVIVYVVGVQVDDRSAELAAGRFLRYDLIIKIEMMYEFAD
jgi:hypothetical protein